MQRAGEWVVYASIRIVVLILAWLILVLVARLACQGAGCRDSARPRESFAGGPIPSSGVPLNRFGAAFNYGAFESARVEVVDASDSLGHAKFLSRQYEDHKPIEIVRVAHSGDLTIYWWRPAKGPKPSIERRMRGEKQAFFDGDCYDSVPLYPGAQETSMPISRDLVR